MININCQQALDLRFKIKNEKDRIIEEHGQFIYDQLLLIIVNKLAVYLTFIVDYNDSTATLELTLEEVNLFILVGIYLL